MNSSLYLERSQEISFERFMQIVTSHSTCSSKDDKNPSVLSDKSKQALQKIYDTIHNKRGYVTVGNADVTGKILA